MAQFQSGFQKYFLLLGVLAVFGFHYGMSRAHNYYKLQNLEREVAGQFKKFKVYAKGAVMPPVHVSGPKGGVVDLSDTKGNFTVLNVWATWCTPCVKELPALALLDGFLRRQGQWRVMAVSIDSQQNLPKLVRFIKKYKVENIAGFHDYNFELQKVMNIKNLPTSFIISPSGEILYEIQGDAVWYDRKILNFLEVVGKVK